MLIFSCHLLTTVLKVGKSLVVRGQMVVGVSFADPCDHKTDWELPLSPASRENIRSHAPGPGKHPNANFKVWFLLSVPYFLTILKSKMHEPNHHRNLGTIYIFDVPSSLQLLNCDFYCSILQVWKF